MMEVSGQWTRKKFYATFSNSRSTSKVFLLTDVAFYIKKIANPPSHQWSGFEWSDLFMHSFIHCSTNIYSKSTLHVNPCQMMVYNGNKTNPNPQGFHSLVEENCTYRSKVILNLNLIVWLLCQALNMVLRLNLHSHPKERLFLPSLCKWNLEVYDINSLGHKLVHEDLELPSVTLRRQT